MALKILEEEKVKQHIKRDYYNFKNKLKGHIRYFNIEENFSEIVFLCIGTNKIIGDMIGPIVGERLKSEIENRLQKNISKKITIYGDLKNTFNLKNASEILEEISKKHKNPFIITIDTALGEKNQIYKIAVTSGNMKIGKAIGNGIEIYSHINIKGVVGKYTKIPKENVEILKSAQIEPIIYLATIITKGIIDVI